MSVRVVVFATLGKAKIVARLREMSGIELSVADDAAALAALAREAEVLILPAPNYQPEVAKAAAEAPNLKWIQTLTAGYDPLERNGVPPGVTVTKAGEAWSPGVAEHGIALLFALVKRVPDILSNAPTHSWDRGFSRQMGGFDGMTLAILGYGSIGRAVAERLRPFGMRIIGLKRTATPDALADEVRPVSDLFAVLERSDAVFVAAPLTAETKGLLGREAFAAIKPGALVVNVSRGGVIDSIALADALKSGRVGGAALDVTDPEPLPPDHALWDAPNLIVSPHVAGACGPRGEERLAEMVGDNLARYLAGQPLEFVVSV